MKAFEEIVIGRNSIPSLILTVVLMIAIPVGFFIFWRGRHRERTKIGWLLAGAAGFLVSARVLELGLHYLCTVADNPVSRFINGNTAAFVLYGTAAAGVFEECGRHVILKYILKKDRTRENAVLYGIGHGGIEVLAVILPTMVLYLAAAVLFASGSTEEALRALKITEETAAAALPSVQAAAAFDFGTAAIHVTERLLTMLIHIGLTVIVFCGVVRAGKGYLPSAILLHMLTDTMPALYQKGAVPLWAAEVWIACWCAVIVFIAVKLWRSMKEAPMAGPAA